MYERENVEKVRLPELILIRAVACFFLTGIAVLLENTNRVNELGSIVNVSNKIYWSMFGVIFLGVNILTVFFRRLFHIEMEMISLLMASLTYCFVIALNTTDVYYISMICLFELVILRYVFERFSYVFEKFDLKSHIVKRTVVILGILTLIYLGSLMVLRILLMKPVTFDFGIFVQMFHYLKETLIPYTTCERYELLSHFAVHFSPIYYFILPVYALFPEPVTLLLVQLLALVSGVIPLYLMCRRKRAEALPTLAICVAYLLYPALRGGLFYDFHENKFLAPLLLWLLYFFEEKDKKKRRIGVLVFAVLTLMVKEDAALYVMCIGLYHWMSGKKERTHYLGCGLAISSLVYFIIVYLFMSVMADGGSAITSFGRYENLTVGGFQGVGDIVMNIVKDPAYVVKQLLSETKLAFLLWMFFPLLFLPLVTKSVVRYVLLLPLVAMNLLSFYPYQHNIYFQYAYGSGVLVIYLAYLELSQAKGNRGKFYAIGIMIVSLLMSTSALAEKNTYLKEYVNDYEFLSEMRAAMKKIPEEGSVSASTSLVPLVAERREVYRYQEGDLTDYIAFNLRTADKYTYELLKDDYISKGYRIFAYIEDKLVILEKE